MSRVRREGRGLSDTDAVLLRRTTGVDEAGWKDFTTGFSRVVFAEVVPGEPWLNEPATMGPMVRWKRDDAPPWCSDDWCPKRPVKRFPWWKR